MLPTCEYKRTIFQLTKFAYIHVYILVMYFMPDDGPGPKHVTLLNAIEKFYARWQDINIIQMQRHNGINLFKTLT